MRYYTIQNEGLLIADNERALTRFYNDVLPLPEDYEEGKYIIGEIEEENTVIDYGEEGIAIGSHTEKITVKKLILNPNWEKEQAEKERERIGNLQVTKRVFALGLEQLGITYSQLKELIATNEQAQLEWDLCVELERKNPLLDLMAAQLGVSSEMLDYIFRKANGEDVELPVIEENSDDE